MTTGYPTPFATWETQIVATPTLPPSRDAVVDGSWRYRRQRVSRLAVAVAAAISAAVHASLFFGSLLLPRKVAPVTRMEEAPVIRLALPELKELEEPEATTDDETAPPVDLAAPVPMQADVPALPTPSDFVQPLNFASLLEQPDFSQIALNVIPENYTRGTRIAERIGRIFNIEDLDRHPQPVLQPSPTYPVSERREGLSAVVKVEFVVDTEGRVLEPFVTESTNSGFNQAAVAGVARWKFRPGIRSGRKVNVRMQVPISFQLMESID